MLSYWVWLGIFVFFPSLLIFLWKRILVWKHRKTVFLCGLSALVFAVPWDNAAIRDGLWSFPKEEILGVWFLGLPLEEFFFIFFVAAELSIAVIALAGGGKCLISSYTSCFPPSFPWCSSTCSESGGWGWKRRRCA